MNTTERKRFVFDLEDLDTSPRNIAEAVKKVVRRSRPTVFNEKRRHQRFHPIATIRAMPIDDEYNPLGNPFEATVKDISAGGIAFFHTRTILQTFLAIEILTAEEDRGIQMILQVLRCEPLGRFYVISGKFVARIDG
jgi:hypothetical protein